MEPRELLIRSRRVVTPDGVRAASVRVCDGLILSIGAPEEPAHGAAVLEFPDSVVMPGLVDTHVHINEPGRADWEGFESATRAAAAGGITTVIDMPLNSIPPTTTLKGLEEKRAAAEGRCFVDVGFWGGLVPGNSQELIPLLQAGVFGFKCFLSPSGVPEFSEVGEADLRRAMPLLAERGALLLVHAELPDRLQSEWRGRHNSYAAYLASRPAAAERDAVLLLSRLCRESGCRVHVLHLSAAKALGPLAEARKEGLGITAETCPHYLLFAAEEIPDGATQFKCAPPIREGKNRDRIWEALKDGTLAMVVSDHSPSSPEKKKLDSGDFREAWGGIASLELTLPATWTAAAERGHTLSDIARWMCEAPALLAGLEDRKGKIAPGYDADLVVWRPEESFEVEPARLAQRHKVTPYAHRLLKGLVETTHLRGKVVYERGEPPGRPTGRLLTP